MNYYLKQPYESDIITQIFLNRGFTKEKIEDFKNKSIHNLTNPNHFKHFEEGCNLLKTAIENKSKILIIVDSDADGYTSSAIIGNYLYENFTLPQIDYQIHNSKFHGIEENKNYDDYDFIIIPDAGSNQEEFVLSLDKPVLILDHHEVLNDYSNDKVIIINNQISDNYPNKSLSGAGVTWHFLSGFENYISNTYILDKPIMKYIDLAMLGNSGDMMDVTEPETKAIIQEGLSTIHSINRSYNSFLSALVEKLSFNLKGVLSSFKISMYIVPLINAITRVGEIEERTVVFKAFLKEYENATLLSNKRGHKQGETETYIQQALRTVTNVRNRQNKLKESNFIELEALIDEEMLKNNPVLFFESNMDRNLNGLVANQLMVKYNRPVLMLNKRVEDGEVIYAGSSRAPNNMKSITSFKKYVEDTHLAMHSLGHASAFGIEISGKNLDLFLEKTKTDIFIPEIDPPIEVDFIFNKDLPIYKPDIFDICSVEKYVGQNFSKPLFVIEDIELTRDNIDLFSPDKNPTLHFNIGNDISCIKFKSSKQAYVELQQPFTKYTLTILGEANLNEWNGNVTPQIIIHDYQITKIDYDF